MSLYHHIRLLPSDDSLHFQRKEAIHIIERVCNKLTEKSSLANEESIKTLLLSAKKDILKDNLGEAKKILENVKNMTDLEKRIKQEEKHFNFRKVLASVVATVSFGLVYGNANAFTTMTYKDANGNQATGTIVNGRVLDKNNQEVGRVGGISNQGAVPNQFGVMFDKNNKPQNFKYNHVEGYAGDSPEQQPSQEGDINERVNIPSKNYNFKTAKQYIDAANKAYRSRNNSELISITEDALRKYHTKTLKISNEELKKIEHGRDIGYINLKNN